jgi:glycine cleavage system aminomethyltransferase T
VSALDFLSVGKAGAGTVAVSAIARAQRDLGARFERRDGWDVPVSIPGEKDHLAAVGIADLSHLTKIELRPAGEPIEGEGIVWYRISPRRALVMCASASAATVREQVGDRFSLDVTGAYSIVALTGSEAATVLRRMTHLHHFPAGGDVAHVQGHVLERGTGRWGPGYWIVCAQEYGQYVWEVAVDRAFALGGGPVGVDAL